MPFPYRLTLNEFAETDDGIPLKLGRRKSCSPFSPLRVTVQHCCVRSHTVTLSSILPIHVSSNVPVVLRLFHPCQTYSPQSSEKLPLSVTTFPVHSSQGPFEYCALPSNFSPPSRRVTSAKTRHVVSLYVLCPVPTPHITSHSKCLPL